MNDVKRREVLQSYGILDTDAEQSFDDLARLAAYSCDAPMAAIIFIDASRQWFKSKIELTAAEMPLAGEFNLDALQPPGVFVAPDVASDKDFALSPLARLDARVRFGAGAPLLTADGCLLGTLCVFDLAPRELGARQAETLLVLARQVMLLLEARRVSGEPVGGRDEELGREAAFSRLQAEQRLQLLESAVQQAKESIIITTGRLDPPGPEIICVNSAFTKTTGYTNQELVGKTPRILQGPRTSRAVLDRMRQCLSQGQPFEGEVINYRKDGTAYSNRWQVAPVRDQAGRVTHYVSIQSDVTQQRRMEAQLAETHKQVRQSHDDMLSILNRLSLGTAMIDESGRVVFLSSAARRVFDKSDQDYVGKRWEEVFNFQEQGCEQLRRMLNLPARSRSKVGVHAEASQGRRHRMEIDVQDDPRDPRRKILLLSDVTEIHDLRRMLDEKAQFHELTGKSKLMQTAFQQIRDVAQVDSTVLIDGETGTGKELVARAIHFSSGRRAKPFIAFNCAGLMDSILTSQLFGHTRGAFTGAIKDHLGFFEAANGGTLFLDEIGDIPMNVQTSLLRVLQEKEITRLGESKPRKVDVRVLAATHRDLGEEVAKGNFRSDLLYRIRVFRIHLPPLRERREDIPLLVGVFLNQFRAATGKNVEEVSHETMRVLLGHNWPGNVRELRSAIEVAVIRCKGPVIEPEDLPPDIGDAAFVKASAGDTDNDERQHLLAVLKSAAGNRDVAARLLGVSRATLYRRLARHGIKISQ